MLDRLRQLRQLFTEINPRTIYLYSVLIGLCAGVGALAFSAVLQATSEVTFVQWLRLSLPLPHGEGAEVLLPNGPPRRWLIVLLPVISETLAS